MNNAYLFCKYTDSFCRECVPCEKCHIQKQYQDWIDAEFDKSVSKD